MDTGELPEQATKRMLEVATQTPAAASFGPSTAVFVLASFTVSFPRDPATAKYAINATVSIMGHALSTLKSGASASAEPSPKVCAGRWGSVAESRP